MATVASKNRLGWCSVSEYLFGDAFICFCVSILLALWRVIGITMHIQSDHTESLAFKGAIKYRASCGRSRSYSGVHWMGSSTRTPSETCADPKFVMEKHGFYDYLYHGSTFLGRS